jgi:hypothetical protein
MDNELDVVKPKKAKLKKSDTNLIYKLILGFIVFIVVIGISFYSGIAYQKGHQPKSTASTNANGRPNIGFSGGLGRFSANRTIGKVTAVNSTSITIQPDFGSNSAKTYSITSSTSVSDQGQSASLSDIAVGDTVLITISSTNTNDAASISVNPAFGNFGGSVSNTTNPSGSSTTGSGSTGSNTTGSASTLN